ncbi:YfgG family protein [Xenorhabdus innexi]|uniref:DUF2633 family protein n=1 Tax=Xenorhabdus innexi TaxID=290109 RepID=A0A1N6MYW8_9GAMM|nr:YfgG family protein [Xenorhabdus innexi]SIP74063.1 conserved exported hypothetical protein [Xenorhabdus innexi]
MKNKKKTAEITKLILFISFLILFGRFIYSSIAALEHHQQKQQNMMEQSSSPKTK